MDRSNELYKAKKKEEKKKRRTLPSSIGGLYASVTLSRKHVGINIFIL